MYNFSNVDKSRIRKWWKDVDALNKYSIDLDTLNNDEDFEDWFSAMFDILKDLSKNEDTKELFRQGKALYNKYALSQFKENKESKISLSTNTNSLNEDLNEPIIYNNPNITKYIYDNNNFEFSDNNIINSDILTNRLFYYLNLNILEDDVEVDTYTGDIKIYTKRKDINKEDIEKVIKNLFYETGNLSDSEIKSLFENLNEEWVLFKFEDGSNPYIAKTKEEQDRIFKKYDDRLRQLSDTIYLIKKEKKVNEDVEEIKFDKDHLGRDIYYKYAFDGNEVKVSPYRLNPNGNYSNNKWNDWQRLTPNEHREFLQYLIDYDKSRIDDLIAQRRKKFDNEIDKLKKEIEDATRVLSKYTNESLKESTNEKTNESFDDEKVKYAVVYRNREDGSLINAKVYDDYSKASAIYQTEMAKRDLDPSIEVDIEDVTPESSLWEESLKEDKSVEDWLKPLFLSDSLERLPFIYIAYEDQDGSTIAKCVWETTPRKAQKHYVEMQEYINANNLKDKYNLNVKEMESRDGGKEFSYALRLTPIKKVGEDYKLNKDIDKRIKMNQDYLDWKHSRNNKQVKYAVPEDNFKSVEDKVNILTSFEIKDKNEKDGYIEFTVSGDGDYYELWKELDDFVKDINTHHNVTVTRKTVGLAEAEENDDTIEVTLDKDTLNDPDELPNFGAIAKDKIDARRKAKIKKELHDRAEKVFNGEVTIEDLFNEYVPSSGKCDTLGGELVRAFNKIDYRWWNDGDKFYDGYGLETSGSAAKFLQDKMEDLEFYNVSQLIVEEAESGEDYDRFIENLKQELTSVFNMNEGRELFETPNEEDMYDTPVDEDTWEVSRGYTYECNAESNAFFDNNSNYMGDYQEELISEFTENFSYVDESDIDIDLDWSNSIVVNNLTESQYDEIKNSNIDTWVSNCFEGMYDNNGGHADNSNISDIIDEIFDRDAEHELWEQAIDKATELFTNEYSCDLYDIYANLITTKNLKNIVRYSIDVDDEETTEIEKELYNRLFR